MAALPCSPAAAAISYRNRLRCSFSSSSVHSNVSLRSSGYRKDFPSPTSIPIVIFCSSTGTSSFPSPLAPAAGRVGWQRRQANVPFLSYGADHHPSYLPNDSSKVDSTSQLLSALLPFVVAATAVAALLNPATFTWVSKDYYAPALGGIMLSIGIRLSVDDFALAFQRPLPLSIGFMAQYVLKPLLGLLIARLFGAPPMFYAGFILTCCVAGAQLSSYASFLSKGDVALSILLTSSTTISSVVITPLLTGLLIGSVVPVDAIAMSKSILQVKDNVPVYSVVLIPVALGLLLNTYAKPVVNVIQPIMPFVAMICTSVCIGSPLALNRTQILSAEGAQLLLPGLQSETHLIDGMDANVKGVQLDDCSTAKLVLTSLGNAQSDDKVFDWQLRQEESVCRTISLCTGMQSSTLAGLLATQFLGSSHAVPPACSVVAMAIMGLYLASFWGKGSRIRDIPKQLFPQISNTSSLNA
ncbi:putative sodium/metabolite cotransporter bass3, chloroplastic [Asimina triloba]